MTYKLMNFNIPIHLKEQLDFIAGHKHISRTAILNLLVDKYCRQEMVLIENTPVILDRGCLPVAPEFSNSTYDPFSLEDL